MESAASVDEATVKSERSTEELDHCIKSEPSWGDDTCAQDPSCWDASVKTESSCVETDPSHADARVNGRVWCPEAEDARGGEAAAAALYADHVVKDELIVGPTLVQSELCAETGPKKQTRLSGRSKTYQCIHCSFSTTRKASLVSHVRKHTNKKLLENRSRDKMPYFQYTKEDLEQALEAVKDGGITAYKASKTYKVPYQTLQDKLKNAHPRPPGHYTVLSMDEEELVVKWLHHMSEIGFPVSKEQLLLSVEKLVKELNKPHKFKDGVPGRCWYEGFLKRHPEVTLRTGQALTTARISATEQKIRIWFNYVYSFFEKENLLDVLNDPSRIFNCDESAFFFCPKGQAVLAKRGQKSVYCQAGNDEKETLTLLVGSSANGTLMPILALFPYKRIPKNISDQYPQTWVIGSSDTGWMSCETFYEYIVNSFNSFLTKHNIKKPVVLFLDGHVSHLSLPLTQFCKENQIILVALLPHATHVLQPMDVAVFRPLKNAWKKNVYDWRMANNGQKLKREDFAPILEKCIEQTLTATIMIHGFRSTGLYPFDQDAINYSKLPTSSQSSDAGSSSDTQSGLNTPSNVINHTETTSLGLASPSPQQMTCSFTHDMFVSAFEKGLGNEKLTRFKNCEGSWQGDTKDENLFYYWKQITSRNDDTLTDEVPIGETTLVANDVRLTDLNLNWVNAEKIQRTVDDNFV